MTSGKMLFGLFVGSNHLVNLQLSFFLVEQVPIDRKLFSLYWFNVGHET